MWATPTTAPFSLKVNGRIGEPEITYNLICTYTVSFLRPWTFRFLYLQSGLGQAVVEDQLWRRTLDYHSEDFWVDSSFTTLGQHGSKKYKNDTGHGFGSSDNTLKLIHTKNGCLDDWTPQNECTCGPLKFGDIVVWKTLLGAPDIAGTPSQWHRWWDELPWVHQRWKAAWHTISPSLLLALVH